MNRLKTYLQISDLHFDGPLQQSAVHPWARYVPLLKGYVGHSQGALGYLTKAFKELRRAEPDVELIVTGDLTAYGKVSQFQLADSFLSTAGQRPSFLGLNAPGWMTLAIPGNHDHWPGNLFPLGTPNSEVSRRFPNDSTVMPSTMLPNGVSVVFLSLNSDAGVTGWSAERCFACGSFVSAVNELDGKLTNRKQDQHEIRVLLLHHSVEYVGRQIPRSLSRVFSASADLRYLTIDNASRRKVADLLDKHGIRVVLTGHIHQPFFVGRLPRSPSNPSYAQRDVMEARCGSTSQRLTAAPSVPIEGGSNAPRYQNSLIVHRLLEDAGRIYWQSEVHAIFLSEGGFRPAPSFLADSPSRGEILVWP